MRTQGMVKANPAGNITLFVFDTVAPEKRSSVAEALMRQDPEVEQVAFVCPPLGKADGRIEMMGGEFCGNATRAFGLLLAEDENIRNRGEVMVECSGVSSPLKVTFHWENQSATARMPLPLSVETRELQGIHGTLVRLPGITHFVVTGMEPAEEILDRIESDLEKTGQSDAYGVCFLNPQTLTMTPLVEVLGTHSRIWEGSCGSGSVACACAQSFGETDGVFEVTYKQPAGSLQVTVTRENGKILDATIGGSVRFD